MAIIKQSNTTKIFEKNNFGKFLPILSNENIVEKLIGSKRLPDDFKKDFNDFLVKRTLPLGQDDIKIELSRISEILQSVSIYGKFTNEILHEISDIQKGLGSSFQICYLKPDEYQYLKNSDTLPDFLNPVSVNEMLGSSSKSINNLSNVNLTPLNEGNIFPYLRDRVNPGLSVIQVLNPELRGCYKNTQELDLFFNMLSTLDVSMAIPYVNADFLIPKKISRSITSDTEVNNNDKSYLTTSLNNFILGDEYFLADENGNMRYDGVTDTAKAINGDFYSDEYSIIRNNIKNNSGQNAQVKKTYHRQAMNNAIFFAPQTMVNGDYNIASNPNALIDKFRPFMSILNLSFDVRPTKGLLYYKTATLDLILYDKARMSQIAPFIKPELLNSVSSEIILEYGWQSNLGDKAYNNPRIVSIGNQDIEYMENPIAEFMNSLKVKEKYIIVNSSYTINANGTVNINLNLALKGASELRGLVFNYDTAVMEMQNKLNQFIEIIKDTAKNQVFLQSSKADEKGRIIATEMTGIPALNSVVADLNINNLDENKLNDIKKVVSDFFGSDKTNQLLSDLNEAINVTKENLSAYRNRGAEYVELNFPFIKEHDAAVNDAFIDWDWWNNNLKTIDVQTNKNPVNEKERGAWNKKEWISLGKLLTCIIGKRLVTEDSKYDEVQFVFYTLNNKALQASFLNIASVPINLLVFKAKLEKLVQNSTKISKEGMIEFILNFAVNQKAAAVFGLGQYFEFTESNSSQPIISVADNASESEKQQARNQQSRAVQAEIFKQYYGSNLYEKDADNNPVFENKELQQIHELCGGVYDLTFNVPKVVINFDSMFHENDPNSSILRVSFYDEKDNPFESITEYMTNFHKSEYKQAVSPLTAVRSLISKTKTLAANIQAANDQRANQPNEVSADNKNEEKPLTNEQLIIAEKEVNYRLRKNINDVIYKLIKDNLVILKDAKGEVISQINNPDNPLANVSKIMINVNNRDKIKNFTSMKSFFKTYMPSLTFGQVNSALISGNVTTNQDPKYSTVQLFRQDGEINQNEILPYNFELFNQLNNSPMMVMPAQASAQIIGCPIVNFSQLMFLDFNTGTSIDNMYIVTGIKHSISPGRFTTDLTLSQRDIYSQFMAEAGAIQEFFKSIDKFKGVTLQSKNNSNLPVVITVPTAQPAIQNNEASNIRYQLIFKVNHNIR